MRVGFPGSSASEESAYNTGDPSSIPGSGRSSGKGSSYPLQYSCLENPHGQRSLAGYSPWDHRVGHDWATKHSAEISQEMGGRDNRKANAFKESEWKLPTLQFYRSFYSRITMVRISSRRKRTREVSLLCFGFLFNMPVVILLNHQVVRFSSLLHKISNPLGLL